MKPSIPKVTIPIPELPIETVVKVIETKTDDLFPLDFEFVSIGFVKIPNTRTYVNYTITTKNGKVIKTEFGRPNLKKVAEHNCKLNFHNKLGKQ
jgi:hypothetical protein